MVLEVFSNPSVSVILHGGPGHVQSEWQHKQAGWKGSASASWRGRTTGWRKKQCKATLPLVFCVLAFISVFLFKPLTNKFLAFILLHCPHFSLSSVEHNFLDKHAPAFLPTAETNGHQAYCSFCAGIVEELEGTERGTWDSSHLACSRATCLCSHFSQLPPG